MIDKNASHCEYLSRWPAPTEEWWDEASARIDAYRKASISIQILDTAGRPIPNYPIDLHQSRSAFMWGSAVDEIMLGQSVLNDDAIRYRQVVQELFPIVTLENGHKWRYWEDSSHRTMTDRAFDWLTSNKIEVRGHTLVWQHKDRTWSLPDDVFDCFDPVYIRARIENHFNQFLGFHAERFSEIDVVNEIWSEHVLTDRLCPTTSKELAPEIVDWFKMAKAKSKAMLYINDYGIIESGGYENTEHQNSYDATISFLLQQGAPLEGIGIQGHFGPGPVPHGPAIWRILDRFARFGLPIRITEFDMFGTHWNEAAQEQYLHEFLTACFSHPAINGFLIWGFWDGSHWFENAPIYRKDWSLKPSGARYLDLVRCKWMTGGIYTTNEEGKVCLQAFLGDYVVKADGDQLFHVALGSSGIEAQLVIKK